MSKIELRPWQSEALAKATKWLVEDAEDRHFLINAAPGAGKTICASVIARRLIENDLIDRVVVIAPRKEVVRQWGEEFEFVTGRTMTKITGAGTDVADFGVDLCATWAAVEALEDAFQLVCKTYRTLVICDEHHHAAVEAAWGSSADSAFADAKFALILTGTPIRSDGEAAVWFAYDDQGRIDHPEGGTYTLTYGEAVELEYCRPITFHRHEGKFTVTLDGGDAVSVAGTTETEIDDSLKKIKGLQQALDFYRLACTPKYIEGTEKPDVNSYQGTMLEWGSSKLDDIRNLVPNAGGLVIAPTIGVAEYMAELIEKIEGEKPILVHSQLPNVESRIDAFKKGSKRWIVSVAMISEGVDIKRLRILVYLPKAKTELAFRQAMGRVVRTLGDEDRSRAYVVMPTLNTLEEYARRVEREMSPAKQKDEDITTKICPKCGETNPKEGTSCEFCSYSFPKREGRFKLCDGCGAMNPVAAKECQNCGDSFSADYSITLNEALRMGAIVRGMDLTEEEVQDAEANKEKIIKEVLNSGDDAIVNLLKKLPEESYGRLRRILQGDDP